MSRRLLAAACGVIYFFLMLPLLVVFPLSLSSAPYMQFPPPGLSWQWYERYLDDPQWIDATWRSLYIGGATAVLALALGVPLAFSLVRGKFAGRVLIDRLALAPVIVPTIILSVAVYGLFAKLKLIGAWYGLVVAHTVLALPFVVLVMTAGLRDFGSVQEQRPLRKSGRRIEQRLVLETLFVRDHAAREALGQRIDGEGEDQQHGRERRGKRPVQGLAHLLLDQDGDHHHPATAQQSRRDEEAERQHEDQD